MQFVTGVAMADPTFYIPLAQAAEQAGFDVITVSDSIGYPQESDSKYPYNADGTREFLENKPFIEPIVAMAAMAAVTTRIEFTPNVLKLPVRHPVLFAKELTSLAVLSGNRINVGVGTSPWPDDYAVVGLPWAGRGRRFIECVEIIRGLATGDYFEYHGEFYDFEPIKLNPVPTRPIPILVGGISPALIERAGRIGDGWMPTGIDRERLVAGLETIARVRDDCGRSDLPFAVYGGAATSPDEIAEMEALGVTHLAGGYGGPFNPYGLAADDEPLEPKIERLLRFGADVIAPSRA